RTPHPPRDQGLREGRPGRLPTRVYDARGGVRSRPCVPGDPSDRSRPQGPGDPISSPASPWDDPGRRPGHAEKRRTRRLPPRRAEIRAVLRPAVTEVEIQAAAERLLGLAAELAWSRAKYRTAGASRDPPHPGTQEQRQAARPGYSHESPPCSGVTG